MMPTPAAAMCGLLPAPRGLRRIREVPGFFIAERAFNPAEEKKLLQAVEDSPVKWTRRRTRITKNYGPYYLYRERDEPDGRFRYTDGNVLHEPLPEFLDELVLPIVVRAAPMLADFEPNQFHVALYRTDGDHKIHMHNDNKMGELGPYIVGMCLKADTYMTFMKPGTSKRKVVHLPRRCVYIMSGDSHFVWRHGIMSKHTKADRVSFTLREVRKLSIEESSKVTKSKHIPSEEAIAKQKEKDSMVLDRYMQNLNIKLVD